MSAIRRFLFHEDEAATAVEYAVMLALILVVCVGAIRSMGNANTGLWWGGIYDEMQSAGL
jgi:Flp pilus assembly pilin Flp